MRKKMIKRSGNFAIKATNYIVAICLIIACCLLSAARCNAAFQDIGWGARPYGMGGAFVALSDDGNASFWNPAGLDRLEQKELCFMYAKPYLGLEGVDWGLLSFAYAHPVKQKKLGVFGLNATSFNIADLYREYSFSLSYAWLVSPAVHGGLSVKYLYHQYKWDDETKNLDDPVVKAGDSKGNISFDLGTIIKPGRFSFGACLKNINQPDVGLYYKDKVPLEIRAGTAYNLGDIRAFEDMVLTFDASYRNQDWAKDTRMNFYLGGESWFRYHTFGLRSGLNFTQSNLNELTFGLSLNKAAGRFILVIDYSVAWSMNIKDNLGTHRISTGARF